MTELIHNTGERLLPEKDAAHAITECFANKPDGMSNKQMHDGKDVQKLNNELHGKGLLPGLNIVGKDSSGHLLIADNNKGADHHVYQLDKTGSTTAVYDLSRENGKSVYKKHTGEPEEKDPYSYHGGGRAPEPMIIHEEAPKPTSPAKLDEFVKNRFAEIDDDGNGHLTREELIDFLDHQRKSRTVTQDERKYVNQLAENVDRIQSLSNDETGYENDGITPADLKEYARLNADTTTHDDFYHQGNRWIERDFELIDTDHDGYMTKEEILDSIRKEWQANAKDSQSKIIYMQELLYQNDEIAKLVNDEWGRETSGISRSDLLLHQAQRKF